MGEVTMTVCVDTDTIVRDAADASIREVFSMMIGEAIDAIDEPSLGPVSTEAMTVLLGLTGEIQGSISVSLGEAAAIQWTKALIDHETTEVDQTVVDAVGELGNMVVGGAKRRMARNGLSMSLPTVFRAGHGSLVFPTHTTPVHIHYRFGHFVLTLVIAMRRA